MKKLIIALGFSVIFSGSAMAEYNSNMQGKVKQVLTYTGHDHIFFSLENQPQDHPTCNVTFFSIDSETAPDRRQQLLSRLLTAYATGERLNIGYDSVGACSHGYIRVHRVG